MKQASAPNLHVAYSIIKQKMYALAQNGAKLFAPKIRRSTYLNIQFMILQNMCLVRILKIHTTYDKCDPPPHKLGLSMRLHITIEQQTRDLASH